MDCKSASLNLNFSTLITLSIVGFALLESCSTPSYLSFQNKNWAEQIGKSVEGQKLIFVGADISGSEENSKFKAEAKSLENLANECSFVPKGTYLADQLMTKTDGQTRVIVKLVVDMNLCEQARNSILPNDIEGLINFGYTEQIQKFQEENEKQITYSAPPPSAKQKVEMILNSDSVALVRDDDDFFLVRQQAAYLKQIILMSKRGKLPTGLINFERVFGVLSEKTSAIRAYEKINPVLKSSSMTWSTVKERLSQNSKIKESVEREKVTTLQKSPKNKAHTLKSRQPAQIEEAK